MTGSTARRPAWHSPSKTAAQALFIGLSVGTAGAAPAVSPFASSALVSEGPSDALAELLVGV